MQIVIDIDENVFTRLFDNGTDFYDTDDILAMAKAIRKGTLLSKSRGKLIILSEDAIKREQTPLSFSCQKWISEVGLSNATIATIETDKEKRNDT